jgi:hypothetical protein
MNLHKYKAYFINIKCYILLGSTSINQPVIGDGYIIYIFVSHQKLLEYINVLYVLFLYTNKTECKNFRAKTFFKIIESYLFKRR